jgi:site-specific recombinase XerD
MTYEPDTDGERASIAAAIEGVDSWGGRQTVEVYVLMIDQFIQHLQYRGLSPATVRRRRETLRQFTKYLHPLPLEQAIEEHIEEFLSGKIAARTRHAYRSDLRVFYTWATKHGHCETNPTADLSRIKVPKSLPRPIDSDAAKDALLFGSRRIRRMVALALYAGLRCHEIAGLQAEDVWTHVRPAMVVVRRGKGGKDRAIEMHPVLAALLTDLPSSGPVFPGRGIPSVRPESVSTAVRTHLLAAGIDGTAHQLRHSFITGIARASGGDMNLTAKMAGHESMNTTMGYVQLAQSGGAEVIARLYQPDDAA